MSVGEGTGTDFSTMRRRNYPTLKQFTVFLENRVGQLQEVVRRFEAQITERTRVMLVSHMINITGQVLPVKLLVQLGRKHGIPVIGMNTEVPDQASVEFSEAFYDALGAGRDLDFAFQLGCSAIELYDLKAEDTPVLKR